MDRDRGVIVIRGGLENFREILYGWKSLVVAGLEFSRKPQCITSSRSDRLSMVKLGQRSAFLLFSRKYLISSYSKHCYDEMGSSYSLDRAFSHFQT